MARDERDLGGGLPGGDGGSGRDQVAAARPRTWKEITQGARVPPVFGTCRVPSLVIYRGLDVSEPVYDSPGGTSTHDARCSATVLGLALGPAAAVTKFWWKDETAPYTTNATNLARLCSESSMWLSIANYVPGNVVSYSGLVYFCILAATGAGQAPSGTTAANTWWRIAYELHLGDGTEPAWTPPSYDPATAGEAFRGVAQFRAQILGMTDEAKVPEIAWEVRGFGVAASGEPDADLRDVAYELCTSTVYGLGLAGGAVQVDTGIDGAAGSSFDAWVTANDWRGSAALSDLSIKEALESLALETFSAILYSEGRVKLIPLSSEAVGGYTPPTPVAIGVNDFADLEVVQVPESEVFNTWRVRYQNRDASGYTPLVVQAQDTAHAALYGPLPAEEIDAVWLKTAERAQKLAQYLCKQSVYARWRVRFTLPRRFILLEPGDLVTLTDGLIFTSGKTFRITAFDPRSDGRIEVEATEVATGVTVPIALTPQEPVVAARTSWSAAADAVAGLVLKADTDMGNVASKQVPQDLMTAGQANTSNLWPNPTSEFDPPAGASAAVIASAEFAGRTSLGVGTAYEGAWVRRISAGGSAASISVVAPFSGGERVSFSARVKKASGAGGGYLAVDFLDSAGSAISTSFSSTITAATWTLASITGALAPTGTVAIQIRINAEAATIADFDAIQARKSDSNGYPLESTAMGAITAIARSTSDPTTARVFWRGNNNPTYSGGAPRLIDPLWARSTAYAKGDVVVGDPSTGGTYPLVYQAGQTGTPQRAYRCTTAGTSAASGAGPTGTGTGITDGSAVWEYAGATYAGRHRFSPQTHRAAQIGTTGWYYYQFLIIVQPRDFTCDNLDGMRYLEVLIYNSVGTQLDTRYVPIADRLFKDLSSDSVAANQLWIHFDWIWNASAGTPFSGYFRVTPYNAHGPGQAVDFGPGAALDTTWAYGAGIPGAGSPPAGGGGGGGDEGGGYCPAPDTLITLDSGRRVPAGELVAGDFVWAQPEHGGPFGSFQVEHVELLEVSDRVAVILEDARRIVCSPGHRFLTPFGFQEAVTLARGEVLLGPEPGRVRHLEAAERGPVVRITVREAHTYVNEGVLVHNTKPPL